VVGLQHPRVPFEGLEYRALDLHQTFVDGRIRGLGLRWLVIAPELNASVAPSPAEFETILSRTVFHGERSLALALTRTREM
jgi:hypothetical protein